MVAEKHVSVDLDSPVFEALKELGRSEDQSPDEMARTLVEEGLRLARHPGIVFRPGPTGRRAGLVDGPDIWQIAYVFRDQPLDTDIAIIDATVRSVGLTGLSTEQLRTAIHYYLDYTDEIEAWIRSNDEEAARAKAEWLRKQELLRA